ncbi:MAG: serine/threonine protein kinase [Planctomycetes bacterium]|nr:serine/threonine protein kinase [Planctomycetota bacterium]
MAADQTGAEEDRDPAGELLSACLERGPAELAAAVEAACSEHPEHAPELRRRLAALHQAGLLNRTPAFGEREFPERLGEFRLLARLGGGGMGVVYRAVQEPLGRSVALKVIRPESLYFPKARERFRREAEAVAKLQHPGIVPIHTVGEAQGVPYFAMELFEGATLAEVIERLAGRAPESLSGADLAALLRPPQAPRASLRAATETEDARAQVFEGTWVQAAVRVAIQVALALAHAHSRGVLHRDVKPSNIALTADGRARLFDFGLAAVEGGADGAAGARVTATGAALGTLLYMSPEQVRGDTRAVGEASDVYSLGVTLYEALTLQVPYLETNTSATRQAIEAGRPDSIRARNRAVPRELETVCLQAMERDPKRRYRDAASFARDLENVLARRPIEARPPGMLLRTRLWVARNPALASSAALALTLVLGVPLGLYGVTKRHAGQLELALGEARRARTAAEKSENEAREQSRLATLSARDSGAVADFLVELFGAADPAISRGEDVRARQLLDEAAAKLDRELADQPEVRRRLRLRMGSSYAGLGEHQKARELFETALKEGAGLHGEDSPECGETHYRLGWTLRALGSPDARREMERALAICRAQRSAAKDDELRILVGMAAVATAERKTDEALAFYEEALALVPETRGDARELRQVVLPNRAHTLYAAKRLEPAARDAREAIELQRELFGLAYPGTLASLNTLALSLKHLERPAEALPVFEELLRTGELVYGKDSPAVAIFGSNYAGLLDDLGRRDEAAHAFEDAWSTFERVTQPTFPQRLTCGMNLALLESRRGNWRRSGELYRDLVDPLLAAEGPTSTRHAVALNNLGLALEAAGRFAEAKEQLERAVKFTRDQQDSNAALRLARLQGSLARLQIRAGELDLAASTSRALGDYVAANPGRASLAAQWNFARGLEAEARGAVADSLAAFEAVAAAEKLDLDARWLPPAARARLAAAAGDDDRLTQAAQELARLLGQGHVEVLAALEGRAKLALAAGEPARAAELRAEAARRAR